MYANMYFEISKVKQLSKFGNTLFSPSLSLSLSISLVLLLVLSASLFLRHFLFLFLFLFLLLFLFLSPSLYRSLWLSLPLSLFLNLFLFLVLSLSLSLSLLPTKVKNTETASLLDRKSSRPLMAAKAETHSTPPKNELFKVDPPKAAKVRGSASNSPFLRGDLRKCR